jgi:hypothetical protein
MWLTQPPLRRAVRFLQQLSDTILERFVCDSAGFVPYVHTVRNNSHTTEHACELSA